MPYNITYNEEHKIIESVFTGTVNIEDLIDLMKSETDLSLRHDCYLSLIDFTRAKIDIDTMTIYNIPNLIEQIARPLGENKHKTRWAMLANKSDVNLAFIEIVTQHRGLKLQLFNSTDIAMLWLLGKN